MDSASFAFIAFGLAVALLSNLNRSRSWRSAILLIASCLLLGILSPGATALLPLIGFLALGYVSILLIRNRWTKLLPVVLVVVVLAFVWLKKYTFIPGQIWLQFPYFTVGLSYIFFRVLHLVIECSEEGPAHTIGVGSYLLYTVNFTTLVSGPIQRYEDFARDQFAEVPLALDIPIIGVQIERIIRGYFKVTVLALLFNMVRLDSFAELSQPVPLAHKLISAFLLAIAYPFFLYANFSGYIDVVIAIARLLRVQLPENFNRPFSATSFLDFWNRWHITLSTWLKTYIYNSLLLALLRNIDARSLSPYLGVLCFFVTFFLVGIWHGRTSEFVVFGLLQGGGVAVNKLWQLLLAKWMGRKQYKALAEKLLYRTLARGLTFSWFAFTLFWFWGSWSQIHTAFSSIGVGLWLCVGFAIWMTGSVVLAGWEVLRSWLLSITVQGQQLVLSRYMRVAYSTAFVLVAFILSALLAQAAPDIIYKAF